MSMMNKTFPFEVKSVDEKSGVFTGYLSVFGNKDSYGDVVVPGAFAKSLAVWNGKGLLPPVLWQHRSGEPIGPFTKMSEDGAGLWVEGQLLVDDIARAREARALLKAKAISGMSIGYEVASGGEDFDAKTGTNYLKELILWEGSIVTFPANDLAGVTEVKSMLLKNGLPRLKEFEDFLREAGFSKTQATAIANHGLSYLLRSESDTSAKSIVDDLVSAIKSAPRVG